MRSSYFALLLGLLIGCGGDEGTTSSLAVDVYGWGPDYQGGVGFVQGLPDFAGANGVQVSVVQPLDGRILGQDVFALSDGNGRVPEVPYGERLRLDFEVLNDVGTVIASGASPTFDFSPDTSRLTFRVQVGQTESFAPYGQIVTGSDGVRKWAQARMDYAAATTEWLGRIGHGVASTSDGSIMVVGGGNPVPGAAVTGLGDFRSLTDDVQIFDVRTGYFSDLSVISRGPVEIAEEDRLFQPVVHPTVTPIGSDRFLVAGGFTAVGSSVVAVDTLQIIDLKAPARSRVQRLKKADGSYSQLKVARGRHMAAYRGVDNSVVVIGGIGVVGDDDILNTFEVVNLDTGVVSGPFDLQEARVEGTAITMFDRTSVWVVGGRDVDSVHNTTEVIKLDNTTAAEATLRQGRFGHGAVQITPGLGGNLLMVVGGFTDLEGNASATFEVGGLGRGAFQTGNSWTMSVPRGRPSVVELPITKDIVVFGGRASGVDQTTVDRLRFTNLGDPQPYVASQGGTMAQARYQASASVASNGKVILIGGFGPYDGSNVAADTALMYNAHEAVPANVQILE